MSSQASGGAGSGPDPDEFEVFRRDYAFAFLTYRVEGNESRLLAAYELGRKAMADGMGLLELSRVHHEVVAEALDETLHEGALQDVAGAASAFFVEVLSTFEMAQRGFAEFRDAAMEKREPPST